MIFDFDQIHKLGSYVVEYSTDRKKLKQDIESILLMSYIDGLEDANAALGTEYEEDFDDMYYLLHLSINGKTYEQRIDEHLDNGDSEAEIQRVIDTEAHRMYNGGEQYVGEQATDDGRTVFKTWTTVGDDKVRDTHSYLEGITIPMGERFYTYDGDSAEYCGGFANAENNVNCRCVIQLTANE